VVSNIDAYLPKAVVVTEEASSHHEQRQLGRRCWYFAFKWPDNETHSIMRERLDSSTAICLQLKGVHATGVNPRPARALECYKAAQCFTTSMVMDQFECMANTTDLNLHVVPEVFLKY
jgi:hypothetical protein